MKHLSTLRLLAIVSLLCVGRTLLAQEAAGVDTIFFQNGTRIVAHVDEIGLDEVKYQLPGENMRVSVARTEVARMVMHTGRAVTFRDDAMSVSYSDRVLAKKHAVKMEVLSLALDHLTLGYEQVLKPWMNLEGRVSYIGVGNANMKDQSTGLMIAGGIKFLARPDHVMRGMKMSHPLQGRYVKPEILFNAFTVTSHSWKETNVWTGSISAGTVPRHTRYTNMAFNIILGKQRFLGNGVTFDTWVGIGYGIQTVHGEDASDEAQKPYCYSHSLCGKELPIALSAGMTLGIAF
ncbi:MAG TPA: hypothetical protein VKG92_09485 [Flavobacteriales bacterium]|nr:hypothetical protein [Flavobacteriales bacterium]